MVTNLEKCSAFGLDKDGRPGIDDTTENCQSCLEQEPELHLACSEECAKTITKPDECPPAQEAPDVEAGPVGDAQKVPEGTEGKEQNMAKEKKEKAPKAPKEPKAPREPSPIVETVVKVLKDATAAEGVKSSDLVANLTERVMCSEATAQTQMRSALTYGVAFGVVEKVAHGTYRWAGK